MGVEILYASGSNLPLRIRLAAGEWKPSPGTFTWTVPPGTNRLEARNVNDFGITGPVSTAKIEGTTKSSAAEEPCSISANGRSVMRTRCAKEDGLIDKTWKELLPR